MMPAMLVTVAVSSVDETITTTQTTLQLIPRVWAASSPAARTVSGQRTAYSAARHAPQIDAGTIRPLMVARARLPNSQKVISGSVFSGLAKYWVPETSALNRAPTTTPASTRMVSDPLPTTRAIITAIMAAP